MTVPPPRGRGGRVRRVLGSLRLRLTLTFVLLLAGVLAALGTYQYVALQRNLIGTRVESLRGDLDEGVALMRRIAAAPVPGTPIGAKVTELDRARALRNAVCAQVDDKSVTGGTPPALLAEALACAISKSSGRTVTVVVDTRTLDTVATAGRPAALIPRLDSAALQQAAGGSRSNAVVLPTQEGDQLAVAFPLDQTLGTATRSQGVVQLATTMQPIDEVLGSERLHLATGGAVVLVLAALAGLWLTGRALKPLRRLTETARELAGGDLRARSRVEPRDDEVGDLAHSFDDMADRIEAAFTAQQQQEAHVRRFIADASHELRTPVTALKGYIDVLQRGVSRDPEALDAALGAMAREAERMRVLVLDLLTLARVDASRREPPEPLALDEVIGGVLDDGVPGMPTDVRRELGSGALVLADRQSLSTMARNLLVNACKYAPGASQVWATFGDGGRAGFRVTDRGPGIPEADLPHVFERFYRGEKTRAREEGGSGLGLSIVQGLARALGGDVGIASEEGRGTTVTVWLPVPSTAATPPLPA